MADEYGYIINRPGYTYNYQKIFNKIINVVDNFNVERYEELVYLGVNPFDLFLLETFLRENNIKNVLELGAGTTTKLLDKLGIERKSYALECMHFTDLEFDKINLYESYETVILILKFLFSFMIGLILKKKPTKNKFFIIIICLNIMTWMLCPIYQ